MIDANFDFTMDSPGYWDRFWERNEGLGSGGSNPDNDSLALQKYHKLLWSKRLPNGETTEPEASSSLYYLIMIFDLRAIMRAMTIGKVL